MSFWNFRKTSSELLGTGVSDLAVLLGQTNFRQDATGAGRPVRRALNPISLNPQVRVTNKTVDVSLRGNGVYLSGAFALTQLSDFAKKRADVTGGN